MARTISVNGIEMTKDAALQEVFPGLGRRLFLFGLLAGFLLAASMDVADVHICVGACDDVG